MTQEEKELLLRDLSVRLSYGVLVQHEKFKNVELKLVAVFNDGRIGVEENGIGLTPTSVDMCKPYLRSMSSMTEEEVKELYALLFKVERMGIPDMYEGPNAVSSLYDWLNKNMFDYRGLIPKGLAIAVTEENNPYKE